MPGSCRHARVVGFFSGNSVIAEFGEPVLAIGRTVVGTPTPQMVRGETG